MRADCGGENEGAGSVIWRKECSSVTLGVGCATPKGAPLVGAPLSLSGRKGDREVAASLGVSDTSALRVPASPQDLNWAEQQHPRRPRTHLCHIRQLGQLARPIHRRLLDGHGAGCGGEGASSEGSVRCWRRGLWGWRSENKSLLESRGVQSQGVGCPSCREAHQHGVGSVGRVRLAD